MPTTVPSSMPLSTKQLACIPCHESPYATKKTESMTCFRHQSRLPYHCVNSQVAVISRDLDPWSFSVLEACFRATNLLQVLAKAPSHQSGQQERVTAETPATATDRVKDNSGTSAGLFLAPQIQLPRKAGVCTGFDKRLAVACLGAALSVDGEHSRRIRWQPQVCCLCDARAHPRRPPVYSLGFGWILASRQWHNESASLACQMRSSRSSTTLVATTLTPLQRRSYYANAISVCSHLCSFCSSWLF